MSLMNPALTRRAFLGGTLAAGAALALEADAGEPGGALRLEEATLDELRLALGIQAVVRLVNPKSIERSEGKAKRIVDRRAVTTSEQGSRP